MLLYQQMALAAQKAHETWHNAENRSQFDVGKWLLRSMSQGLETQQVVSYNALVQNLLDMKDHYASHRYKKINLGAFEGYVKFLERTTAEEAEVPYFQAVLNIENEFEEHVTLNSGEGQNGPVGIISSVVNDYVNQGAPLEELSLFQVTASFERQKINTNTDFLAAETRGGPKALVRCIFTDDHPQADTHWFLEVPYRNSGPICAVFPDRTSEDPKEQERLSRLILLYLKPWRNLADLKSATQSWQEALVEFEAGESPWTKEANLIIKRIQERREMDRRAKDQHTERTRLLKDRDRPYGPQVDLTQDGVALAVDIEELNNQAELEMNAEAIDKTLTKPNLWSTDAENLPKKALYTAPKPIKPFKGTFKRCIAEGLDEKWTQERHELIAKSRIALEENEALLREKKLEPKQPEKSSETGVPRFGMSVAERAFYEFLVIRTSMKLNEKQTYVLFLVVDSWLKQLDGSSDYEGRRVFTTGSAAMRAGQVFGNKDVFVFGDLFQLKSVSGTPIYKKKKENHRQKEDLSGFMDALEAIRKHEASDAHYDLLFEHSLDKIYKTKDGDPLTTKSQEEIETEFAAVAERFKGRGRNCTEACSSPLDQPGSSQGYGQSQ
ncbi:hypothetical protein PTNB73_04721 [Pyrenophora teres f. teres]|nr:hypothetical protein PTNB85_03729 [Pyrenophora teres f. teres]KAE8863829.1 hypothetical protein PTNB29_03793 [Pyrenophora teres f. teres]KAE8866627.1 hypothetical protein PTNB73_04721 [Pyrenophora teres f. teres]